MQAAPCKVEYYKGYYYLTQSNGDVIATKSKANLVKYIDAFCN